KPRGVARSGGLINVVAILHLLFIFVATPAAVWPPGVSPVLVRARAPDYCPGHKVSAALCQRAIHQGCPVFESYAHVRAGGDRQASDNKHAVLDAVRDPGRVGKQLLYTRRHVEIAPWCARHDLEAVAEPPREFDQQITWRGQEPILH